VLYDDTELGDRVILHSGVVLGSDGFGYAQEGGRHLKIPQLGRVVLEDDVEIGANSTVDRGALEETRIGAGTKIDNLVMVAHNVRIGPHCILVAQSGISGSTRLGHHVIVAGQSGAVGHIRIGDGARVGAKSAVTHDLPDGAFVTGHPAQDHRRWLKERALSGRLEELFQRLKQVEAKLKTEKERA
jgi:UDP-3-O-[3-hydroxymyristoyl] glucosamine N-acyltransferase